jgi:hypothetical protein
VERLLWEQEAGGSNPPVPMRRGPGADSKRAHGPNGLLRSGRIPPTVGFVQSARLDTAEAGRLTPPGRIRERRASDPRPNYTQTRMGRVVVLGAVVVLLAAGCAGQSNYTADKTRACLTGEDARIAPTRGDFVASTATGGAFVAHLPDNSVTVAFGKKMNDAKDIQIAYQRFAGTNVRSNITDVLSRYRNAVLLWHQHPADADLALVTGCLN